MSKRTKIILVALVVILAAASRLVEHPYNFTPIIAMSIFAGCYLRNKWAVFLPILAMLVSDYFIGFYNFQVMAAVYIAVALAFSLGWYLRSRKKWFNVALAALVSSLAFFFITNFAVWAFFDWYPHTWAGLYICFILAVPFFRNTLIGNLFYTTVFFGVYEIILVLASHQSLVKAVKKEFLG